MLEQRIESESIYDKIGEKGLWRIVLKSAPWYRVPFTFIIIGKYRRALKNCTNLRQLIDYHSLYYSNSATYRVFRPLHRRASKTLSEEYNIR